MSIAEEQGISLTGERKEAAIRAYEQYILLNLRIPPEIRKIPNAMDADIPLTAQMLRRHTAMLTHEPEHHDIGKRIMQNIIEGKLLEGDRAKKFGSYFRRVLNHIRHRESIPALEGCITPAVIVSSILSLYVTASAAKETINNVLQKFDECMAAKDIDAVLAPPPAQPSAKRPGGLFELLTSFMRGRG